MHSWWHQQPWNGGTWPPTPQWGDSSSHAQHRPAEPRSSNQPDQRSWGERYTYLNGPHKATHTLPVEDRVWLAREMVSRSQADEDPCNVVKMPLVKTLAWPADVIDSVIFLLSGLGRRVSLRSVGETADEVAANMAEGMMSHHPDRARRADTIQKIIEGADRQASKLVPSAPNPVRTAGLALLPFQRMLVSWPHGPFHPCP